MTTIWDPNQYWEKAQLYASRSAEDGREEWERPFWSVLALELLARAALCNIHPVLNADPQDEFNIFYAVGLDIKKHPRSIPIHSVLARLERFLPEFTKPLREFCDFFVMVRNREFHTSEIAFEGLAEAEWLPRYYKTCQTLCNSLGSKLDDLFGSDEAATALKLIGALESGRMAAVKKQIAAHRATFGAKPDDERQALKKEQEVVSKTWRTPDTAVQCPSCGSLAKLGGDLEKVSEPQYREGELLVEETYLASRLECGACGLVLKDIDELHQTGIDPHFTWVRSTDLHAYYDPEYYEEYNNM